MSYLSSTKQRSDATDGCAQTYREGVGCIRDKKTRLSDGTVSDDYTLDGLHDCECEYESAGRGAKMGVTQLCAKKRFGNVMLLDVSLLWTALKWARTMLCNGGSVVVDAIDSVRLC